MILHKRPVRQRKVPRIHSKHKIHLSFVTWTSEWLHTGNETWCENTFLCREIKNTFVMLLLSKAKDKMVSYLREWVLQAIFIQRPAYLGNFCGLLLLIWNGWGGKKRTKLSELCVTFEAYFLHHTNNENHILSHCVLIWFPKSNTPVPAFLCGPHPIISHLELGEEVEWSTNPKTNYCNSPYLTTAHLSWVWFYTFLGRIHILYYLKQMRHLLV